jgi:hypothetical protein
MTARFNVIGSATTAEIPLTRYAAATCIAWEDDGSQIVTVREIDSTGTNADQTLDPALPAYKGPGVGGTWSAGPTVSSGAFDLADDTTNDCLVITVLADELSDGYDSIEFTHDGTAAETCVVILHDAVVQRTPTNLTSSLTA